MRTYRLQTIVASIVLAVALVLVAVPVYAQELQTTPARPMMTTNEPAPTATETAPAANRVTTQSAEKTQAERIAERKAAAKTKLTTNQQKRIKDRCKGAQGKITEATAKATIVQQNRLKVHQDVVTRLAAFEAKVTGQGVDTTALKEQLTALQTLVTAFETDLKTYSDAVADTAALDCVADPVAFNASLEASRTALAKVRADAVAIRTHVNDKVKPAMVTIKTQLAQSQGVTNGQ